MFTLYWGFKEHDSQLFETISPLKIFYLYSDWQCEILSDSSYKGMDKNNWMTINA